jgi:hypothetical protein
MAVGHETVVFDVEDFKVYKMLTDNSASANPTYGPAVDVPGIAEVGLEPNFVTAELKGDATVIAKKGRVDRMQVSATYGKVSIDVLDVILGGTITDEADAASWELEGANSLPYFKAEFRIADVELGLGSVNVVVFKAQLTGGTLLGGSSDQFGQPTMQIEGIRTDSDDKMVKVTFNRTLTELSS